LHIKSLHGLEANVDYFAQTSEGKIALLKYLMRYGFERRTPWSATLLTNPIETERQTETNGMDYVDMHLIKTADYQNNPEIRSLLQSMGNTGKAELLLTMLKETFGWKQELCSKAFQMHFGIDRETIIVHPHAAFIHTDPKGMSVLQPDIDFFTSKEALLQYFYELYECLPIRKEEDKNTPLSLSTSLPATPLESPSISRSRPLSTSRPLSVSLVNTAVNDAPQDWNALLDSLEIPLSHFAEFKAATLHDGFDMEALNIATALKRKNWSILINALVEKGGWMAKVFSGRIIYFKYKFEACRCQSVQDLQPLLFRSAFTSREQVMQYVECKLQPDSEKEEEGDDDIKPHHEKKRLRSSSNHL
jgi:hypothetical protein